MVRPVCPPPAVPGDLPRHHRRVPADGGGYVFLLHMRSEATGDFLPVGQCEHFPAHASPDSLARSPEPLTQRKSFIWRSHTSRTRIPPVTPHCQDRLRSRSLSGSVLVDAGDMFEIERSLPHGHVAAAHVMASRLGLKKLLGPDCLERDLAYGLIIARAVAPASKLATTRWWADTTLGADLGIGSASTDEVYAAMDWLLSRQDAIEKKLADRHLAVAAWHCSICRRRGWKGEAARWGRSGIPGTARRTGSDRVRHGHQPGRDPGRGPGIRGQYLRLGRVRGNHPGRARHIRAR